MAGKSASIKTGISHFDYRRVFASTSPFLLFQSLSITRKSSEFPLNHGPQTWGQPESEAGIKAMRWTPDEALARGEDGDAKRR